MNGNWSPGRPSRLVVGWGWEWTGEEDEVGKYEGGVGEGGPPGGWFIISMSEFVNCRFLQGW